ncbi:MAG: RHS repeat-associated core domain-containing protein [Acidobacteria bacterium]|nr:RHS repeat-associated core domain-containing protein [Acidobacteriota bacterium]
MDYANARTYASERGRFIQPDPISIGGARLEQPQSMNRYAYVQNDPINFVDKSGLLLESPDGISGSGSDCQSIFVAVDWWSDDGPTGTGVLSYGFTYRSCVTSSGGSSGGGAAPLVPAVTKDDLIRALERLPRGCIDFFGGQGTINQRIQELRNGTMMITFIDMRSQGGQLIPDDVYRRTYQKYWNQDAARGGNPNALASSLAIRGQALTKRSFLARAFRSWLGV